MERTAIDWKAFCASHGSKLDEFVEQIAVGLDSSQPGPWTVDRAVLGMLVQKLRSEPTDEMVLAMEGKIAEIGGWESIGEMRKWWVDDNDLPLGHEELREVLRAALLAR